MPLAPAGQPLIRPLYDGISPHVLAAALLAEWPANDYDIVRTYWRGALADGDFLSSAGQGMTA